MEAGGCEAATLTLNSSLSPAPATSAPTRHVMSGAGRAPATAHRSTASAPSETTTAAQLSAATAQLRLRCVGAVRRSSCRAAWRGRPSSVLAASQVTTLSARARGTEARRRLLVVTPASSLDTL